MIVKEIRENWGIILRPSTRMMDMLPLTLEEIFIYELGGENYEVKDIIL